MALVRIMLLVYLAFWVLRVLRRLLLVLQQVAQQQAQGGPAFGGPQRPPMQAPPAADSPYDILGIHPPFTPEALRRAYQTKVAQVHPDQVAQLSPELRRLAEERTKEINAAYTELRRRHGG